FVVVLWHVGGSLDVALPGSVVTIAGYLVGAAVVYAMLTTGTLMIVGRRMIGVIESKNQAESELKYVVAHLRERRDADLSLAEVVATTEEVCLALRDVIRQWRFLTWRFM